MQNGRQIQEQPGLGVGWPLDTQGRAAPLVLPSGALAAVQTSAGTEISSISYDVDGKILAYVESGVTYSLTYDGQNRVSTVTGGGITRTVTYNGNGTVATYL